MPDASLPDQPELRITLVWSPSARQVHECLLCLPPGATVLDALEAGASVVCYPGTDLQQADAGVWGRRASMDQALSDLDRVELYRPLQVDPKLARRTRFRAQGARTAGLFAKKRAGAKAGY